MTATLELLQQLINRESVTPNDAGCQQLLAARLTPLGFDNQHLRYGEVDNLWARRGTSGPLFVFAGHTDVVPSGDINSWSSPPFSASIRDGKLYGRGAADMKSNIAAMLVAIEQFVQQHPEHHGSIALLITSDEEGEAKHGTRQVIEKLQREQQHIDYCLVGEPSSNQRLGDIVKNGRRGSLSAQLQVHGIQGHVAYPELAANPIHLAAAFIDELCATSWDAGNEFFPATSMQISNINAGTGAGNVIPGSLHMQFNFRYSTATTKEELQSKIKDLLEKHKLNYSIEWQHSGAPFLTASGKLLAAIQSAVQQVCGYSCSPSTSGGTSDGRFIAPTGAEVVELGVNNHSIHQVDEHVDIAELEQLQKLYLQILKNLLLD